MSKKPVSLPPKNGSEDAGQESRVLNVGELHYHPNEIDSLRKLAEADPDLARIVVDQKSAFDVREHGSFRFGVVATSLLVLAIIAALSYVVVKLGVVSSLVVIFGILVVALLIRVLLTGRWSETSWIGHLVEAIVKILGGTLKAKLTAKHTAPSIPAPTAAPIAVAAPSSSSAQAGHTRSGTSPHMPSHIKGREASPPALFQH
jgi:hypothetical protein